MCIEGIMCLPIFSLNFLTEEHGKFICGDNCFFRDFQIGTNSSQFSPYILCVWLIGDGSLPISFLYSAFPDNMFRCAILYQNDVSIKSSLCQYTCPNINVRLIWDRCCFISD